MDTLLKNKWSSAGLFLGAFALTLSLLHVNLGPFAAPPTTLEIVVAEQVSAIKKGIIAGLKGEKTLIPAKNNTHNIDDILDCIEIGSAVIAMLLAFIAGMCKESHWSVTGSLAFGMATLGLHIFLFSVGLIFFILLLVVILFILSNFLF